MSDFNEAVFYHIYPIGLCNAPQKNDYHSSVIHRIEYIYKIADHIQALGINAIYFGPLFESGSHGYDTTDYYHIDRRLGDRKSLANVIDYLHKKGIKVIFDAVFNHVGRDFWAFKDVLKNGKNSIYCDWFKNINFDKRSPYGDSFSYEGWNDHYNLVKLNLENYYVKEHLFKAVEMWVNELGIDGLRLDAADCLSKNFIKELRKFCDKLKTGFWLKGEIIHGDYRDWVNQEMFDSVTNYELYKGLYSSHNDKNYFEIAYSLNRQFGENGIYKNMQLYSFTDNHDVDRIASQLNNFNHIYPLHTILFTMPGIPSIYYGSEWATLGRKHNGNDLPLRASIEQIISSKKSESLLLEKLISKLSNIRKNSNSLKYGDYRQIYISHQQFAFSRNYNDKQTIVILNSSDKDNNIDLNADGTFYDLLNDQTININHQNNRQINIKANWARILEKV